VPIYKSQNKEEINHYRPVSLVFLDLSKAVDIISHMTLLAKVAHYGGVRGVVLE
jgi:hypothetical protein